MTDPYSILGISSNCTDEELTKAYRKLAKKYHPDLNPGNEEAAKKMSEINAAYDRIKVIRQGGVDPEANKGGYNAGYNTGYSGYYNYSGYGNAGSYTMTDAQKIQQATLLLNMGRAYEAIRILATVSNRTPRWSYLNAAANMKIGNIVAAMEYARQAYESEPDNQDYKNLYDKLNNGGAEYMNKSRSYGSMESAFRFCIPILLLNLFCNFRFCFC